MAGYNAETSIKVGVFAGISSYANGVIGAEFKVDSAWGKFSNTMAHGVWGCVEGKMQGGDCGSGFRGGVVGAAWSNYGTGDAGGAKPTINQRIGNTMVHAVVGGIAAVAGGGSFAQGAQSAAFAYLFNYLAHVHRNISMHAGARSGLTYNQLDQLGGLVVEVDALPGSQSPEAAYMHGMCEAGMGATQCGLATFDYRERMWNAKSVEGLAGLMHLDQDSFAPKHAGGQSYSGFGLSNLGEAIGHGWSDRSPSSDVRMNLIERSRVLINNYDAFCAGCVRNSLGRR